MGLPARDLGNVNADQAAGLLRTLQRRVVPALGHLRGHAAQRAAGASYPLVINLSSGLVTALPSFVAADAAVQRALSLLFVSLAAIAAVVVLLGARLVTEHRRGEFALMRARGACGGADRGGGLRSAARRWCCQPPWWRSPRRSWSTPGRPRGCPGGWPA